MVLTTAETANCPSREADTTWVKPKYIIDNNTYFLYIYAHWYWLFYYNHVFGNYMWVGNKILNNNVMILELYYLLIKYVQFQCLTLHTAIGHGNLVPLNTYNSANPLSVFSTPWTGHPQFGYYLLARSASGTRIKLRCLASMAMAWWVVLHHLQALPLV
jgi:hypothetical protein